jgi:hypothetical protein
MRKSPYRPFTPKREQLVLMPATSGNTINGMGETAFRQASRVYWHDPDTIEHGDLQKWFYTQDPDNQAIVKARAARAKMLDIEVPPDAIGPKKVMVRGENKWYVNFDQCIPFFNEYFGCGICIVVCPWSKPGRGPRIVEQLKRRAQRQKLQH